MRSALGFRPTLSPGSWQSPGSVRKSKEAGCRATWLNRRMADDMEITLHSKGLQVRFPQPGQPTGKRRRNASGGKGPYFLSNRGPVAFQPRPTSMPVNACLQGCQAPFPPEMYIHVNQSSANISPRFPPCTPGLHPPHGIHETPEMFPMQKEVKYQYKTLERKAGSYKGVQAGRTRRMRTEVWGGQSTAPFSCEVPRPGEVTGMARCESGAERPSQNWNRKDSKPFSNNYN